MYSVFLSSCNCFNTNFVFFYRVLVLFFFYMLCFCCCCHIKNTPITLIPMTFLVFFFVLYCCCHIDFYPFPFFFALNFFFCFFFHFKSINVTTIVFFFLAFFFFLIYIFLPLCVGIYGFIYIYLFYIVYDCVSPEGSDVIGGKSERERWRNVCDKSFLIIFANIYLIHHCLVRYRKWFVNIQKDPFRIVYTIFIPFCCCWFWL